MSKPNSLGEEAQMKLTILIAIADDDVAQKYARFFGRSGFDVSLVSRGTDCWDVLQHEQPVALILDEALPWGGDGVLARLREEANADSPPVVLLAHPASVQRQSFGRGLYSDDAFPVVARFTKSVSLPKVLNVVLGGLRDFHPRSDREDFHSICARDLDSQSMLV